LEKGENNRYRSEWVLDKKVLLSFLVYFGGLLGFDISDSFFEYSSSSKLIINFIYFPITLGLIIYWLIADSRKQLFKKPLAAKTKSILMVIIGFFAILVGQGIINIIKTNIVVLDSTGSHTENLMKLFPLYFLISAFIGPITEELIFEEDF
jgi:membrane protease YdiL (CAAX protease family)